METIAFSVIVPTFNRLPSLRNTLDSLFRQDYSPVEIIVVDDGSTDATPLYLAELASAGAIRHIRQENRGPAAARNAGAAIARGTIIGFTDDDCTLPADWVSDYVRTFASCDAALVGGIALNHCFSHIEQYGHPRIRVLRFGWIR
jgi:glycosyltransferase involved in cell wall biosynthesis